ncbi:MAG: heavy metal translocating P-type ATPase metal-binding domain-containing protein [Gemmatimonadales bacterium]
MTSSCPHCGTAVEGPENAYCCHGCEVAAAIIRGAGLERYYAEREEFAPRPEPMAGGWAEVPVATGPDGHSEVQLAIDGLRCASCVWVTEKVLQCTPGVEAAMVSYATGRCSLRWNPAQVDLPALARRIAALGYRPRPLAAEHAPDRGLMLRMGVAIFAMLAIMGMYEGLYAGWWYGNMDARYGALFRWVSLILATPVTLWCASPFFAGAWQGLRHRVLHMDLPIALGVAILYAHGLVTTIRGTDGYLDSLAMLVALLLAGRVLESRGRRRAADAAATLAGAVPRTARRVTRSDEDNERIETVSVSELRLDDRVDVGSGEEFAADGVVVQGSGQVRMALVTGEAAPVLVGPGDRVVAGALLLDGALTIAVEAVGDETVVHRMAQSLQSSQDREMAPSSTDRIAPWFTAATLLVAVLTFVGWWLARDAGTAISRTVAVLVVACPCALALAQPLAAAAGLGAAARRGLLLRSGDALLALGRVRVAGLDKTGTATMGAVEVIDADRAALRIAAGLERYSVHPIARAITAEAAKRGIPLPQAEDVHETAGAGITGMVDGERWELASGGPGVVELRREGAAEPTARIELGDTIRPDTALAVADLDRLAIGATLLTGDHKAVGRRIASQAGIRNVAARLTPEDKAEWIRLRQAEGKPVLFAGDGLNDGPALAAADVGIAMSGGAASSLLVADGIVANGSLRPVVAGIRAARAAERAIRRSQVQSIVYNVLSVVAAAAGWVNPLVAAVLMPLSSISIIWNAARVERVVRKEEACRR